MRAAAACVLLLAGRGGQAPLATPAETPWAIAGVAEVRVTSSDGRASSRFVFHAAAEPPAMRVELVRAGQPGAVLWADASRVQVLVPERDALLHEGPATRATLEAALGLPFCPEELLFALLAGHAPQPRCGGEIPVVVQRHDRVLSLERPDSEESPGVSVAFTRFMDEDGLTWPRRAELRTGSVSALVSFTSVQRRDLEPRPLSDRETAGARRVDAGQVAAALGVREPAP